MTLLASGGVERYSEESEGVESKVMVSRFGRYSVECLATAFFLSMFPSNYPLFLSYLS